MERVIGIKWKLLRVCLFLVLLFPVFLLNVILISKADTGKNMLDPANIEVGYLSSVNGAPYAQTSYTYFARSINPIAVSASTTYTVSVNNTDPAYVNVAIIAFFYYNTGAYISSELIPASSQLTEGKNHTFTTPSNCTSLKLCYRNGQSSGTIDIAVLQSAKLQLEVGIVSTAYVPYGYIEPSSSSQTSSTSVSSSQASSISSSSSQTSSIVTNGYMTGFLNLMSVTVLGIFSQPNFIVIAGFGFISLLFVFINKVKGGG